MHYLENLGMYFLQNPEANGSLFVPPIQDEAHYPSRCLPSRKDRKRENEGKQYHEELEEATVALTTVATTATAMMVIIASIRPMALSKGVTIWELHGVTL